ncbi:L-asparaginase-like [Acipenser oxyrinchus oxyrinchus]|uniref:L-asparaginase-like n=1 Tax=Acipenser oxyrinchus oxyrinchus TaxID=40147 RepID=A0AAD8CVY4_ACIOX|nr:L-asparaginase-like [Acipenser oxyrinchus oxyrinchus]
MRAISSAMGGQQSKNIQKGNYRFWSAVASAIRLGWIGIGEKQKEMKVTQLSLFPLLMCTAALQGDIVALEGHLQQGANAMMTANNGRTPLHLAAGEGDLDTVKFLLKKGADVNSRDKFKDPVLRDAVRCKSLELVEHLVSAGAHLETAGDELGREMCSLAYLNDMKQMEIWKAAGVHFNFADRNNRTPLHVAVCTNQPEMVLFCLKNGSDPQLRDCYNNTPIADARRLGFKHIEELLLIDQAKKAKAATLKAVEVKPLEQ